MSDLISRQEAINAILELQDCYNGFSDTYDKSCIVGVLEEVPSAERPKGKWIEHGEPDENGKFELWYCACSLCGTVGLSGYRYCPNCGAEMESEE